MSLLFKRFLNFYIKSGKGPDNTGTMLFVNWTKQDCVPKYWSKDNHSQNHFIVSVHSHKYKIRSLCAVIDSIINLNGFILVYLYLLSVDSLQNKISAGSMSVYSHRFTHRSEWNLFSCLCAVFSRNPVPVLIRQCQFYAKKWIAVERNWRKDTPLPDVLSRCHPYNRYRIYVDKFKCFAKVGRGQNDDGPLSHSQSVPKCLRLVTVEIQIATIHHLQHAFWYVVVKPSYFCFFCFCSMLFLYRTQLKVVVKGYHVHWKHFCPFNNLRSNINHEGFWLPSSQ